MKAIFVSQASVRIFIIGWNRKGQRSFLLDNIRTRRRKRRKSHNGSEPDREVHTCNPSTWEDSVQQVWATCETVSKQNKQADPSTSPKCLDSL